MIGHWTEHVKQWHIKSVAFLALIGAIALVAVAIETLLLIIETIRAL
jgi:hypothetical protein